MTSIFVWHSEEKKGINLTKSILPEEFKASYEKICSLARRNASTWVKKKKARSAEYSDKLLKFHRHTLIYSGK